MCGGLDRKRVAKSLNLGLSYGMGKARMAAELGLTLEEAEPVFKQYHAGVPYVKLLADRCTAVASQRGTSRG
jgi:DNA polymerase I-like protein with 3'-5' exonuclease and polymerase domains